MKNGKFQRNIFVLLLFLIVSLSADCDSSGPGTITGPQGTTTAGGFTLAVTTSKTTVGLNDTFIVTVRMSCNGDFGFGTGICGPGDYDLAFSTGAKVTPTSGLTEFSVAFVPATPTDPATVDPLTGGFFTDTTLTASARGTAVITGTFSGHGLAFTATVEVKIV